jgi:GNAT superfamily N-acetyltransferase
MLETVKFILKMLMENNKVKGNIHKIYENWNETIIWSCLQGTMGEIHTNVSEDAAMAILGDFAFYAGNPSEDLVKYKPESCKQDFIIMVPQNANWAEVIEKCYGNKAKKVTRYAIRKEMEIFDVGKLQQAVDSLQSGYVIKKIEEAEYNMCKENAWANDLVSQYKDYKAYKNFGLGIVVLKDGEVVAGASSYSRYDRGIEIEIDTREDHRRKGLAYACGAKLILECLEEGLYPSWDAQNKWSVALAEKLGYHFSHEYVAYEIMGY